MRTASCEPPHYHGWLESLLFSGKSLLMQSGWSPRFVWATTAREQAMARQEVLQCPLCHGHSQVSLSELREFAKSGAFQQTVEQLLAASTSELLRPAPATKDVPSPRDFQK